MALDRSLAERSVCYLSTVGRVSGEWRELEIWFAADPDRDRIYILSGGRYRANWVRNIRASASVRVRIGGARFDGTASEVEGEPDEARARQLVGEKYGGPGGGSLSRWARTSLPVAIDLRPV